MARTAVPLVLFISAFALTACDDPAPPPTQPPAAAATKPNELTPQQSADCVQYGVLAGHMAEDRDSGVPLSKQLTTIRKMGNSVAIDEFSNMAKLVYQNPAFNRQEPKSEAMSFAMDCDLRVLKKQGGAKYFNTAEEIADGLSGFKTFNGTPLLRLLGQYGIQITYVEAVPAEVFAPATYEKGDLVYSMTYGKGASRSMPCHLKDWFKGQAMPIPEFIRRGEAFPLVRPDEDDAVIYWAATGKCSTAY